MSRKLRLFAILSIAFLGSCTAQNHYLITSTGTVIGVDITKDPTSNAPTATLGYKRAELALVPTNRKICAEKDSDQSINCETKPIGDGAADLGDVLMELRYGGIFDLGASSGIYQRLAVGATAVSQPGAAFMFARDGDSEISDETAESVKESIEAQVETLSTRSAEFVQPERQARVDQLLDHIDELDDATAIDLNTNLPVNDPEVENVVALRDPGNRRLNDGEVARSMLRMRAVLNTRTEESLQKWEAAVTSNTN